MRVRNRSDYKGTKDDPIIVDAMDKFRLVGCVCEEHAAHIKWMWLIEGRPKRCGCGHWMELKVLATKNFSSLILFICGNS